MTEYQYNVEVKSRFALFLDDALSNEDPNLLLSKLQKKREKSKKEKIQVTQQPNATTKTEELPKPEVKVEPVAIKVVQPSVQKSPRPNAPVEVENGTDSVSKTFDGNSTGHPVRGRGGFRPSSRGFRGGRGQGPRGFAPEISDVTDEAGDQRDTHYEPRGRGRGRGRGMFTRDRGSHFGDRKFDNFNEDKAGHRPYGERDDRDAQVMSADDKVGDELPVGGDTHDAAEPKENGEEHATLEDEPKIYTLAEYKAMKKLTKPTVVLNTQASRQANDGKDVFANMVVIHKAREVPDNNVKVEETEPQEQPISTPDGYNSRGRGRAFREFSNRGDRGGFSRGPRGRGGGRGRGRGGFRENRDREYDGPAPVHHMPPPSLDNDVEFPSLT